MLALAQQSNILDFPTVAPQGKSSEWYTPSRYIEAARTVMGSIDLDPASCDVANRTVKATRFYSKEENGLMQPWYGNVWLNPPYGRDTSGTGVWKGGGKSLVAKWVEKIILEYQSGQIEQAILLTQADMDANWFQHLWNYILCFPAKIIHFIVPAKENNHHIFGSAFVYLGPNEQKFIDVFSQFGTIAKRVSQPRHTIATPSLWEVQ